MQGEAWKALLNLANLLYRKASVLIVQSIYNVYIDRYLPHNIDLSETVQGEAWKALLYLANLLSRNASGLIVL